MTRNERAIRDMAEELRRAGKKMGLEINEEKTKYMKITADGKISTT